MIIVKIGGGNSINLPGIASDLADIHEPMLIVHGANALRDELLQKFGLNKKIVTSQSGYSSVFSDKQALDVMMMAYSGLRNKRLVELLQQNGINAIGLTGLDGRVIQGRRNRGIRVKENGKIKLLRDFSGKPQSVNEQLLNFLLDQCYTPVLTVPIIDENGTAINSENDDIVALLQTVFKAHIVLQLIEAPGLLVDNADEHSLIEQLSQQELARREAAAEGRMKRKLHALVKLFENSSPRVIIADGRSEHPIKDALNGKGTVIK